MNNDSMLAKFDEWATKEKWPLDHPMRHELLVAWQDSRLALVVELPTYDDDAVQYGWSPSKVIESLTKAGVSYK